MHRVVHTIRDIARHEVARQWNAAFGVVKSVKTGQHHSCTVELREQHLVLPDVPVMVGVMGAAAPPDPGDLVLVMFASGDLHGPVVRGAAVQRRDRAAAKFAGRDRPDSSLVPKPRPPTASI